MRNTNFRDYVVGMGDAVLGIGIKIPNPSFDYCRGYVAGVRLRKETKVELTKQQTKGKVIP